MMLSLNEDDLRPINQLIVKIFRLNGELLDEGGRLVNDIGLTPAWWQVLGALALSPAPPTVAQIARNIGLARQSVQRIVDLLCEKGFVHMEFNPHHRRAKLTVMTERGAAVFREAQERQRPWADQLSQGLSDRELGFVVSILDKLQYNMGRRGKNSG
jgi:DNA-binding MarR family transcriptional regulator